MSGDDPKAVSSTLDNGVPQPARIYDYLLGGTANFPADRDAAEEIRRRLPSITTSMRANRRFVTRAARHLAAERGIRQFLDLGSGLPTAPNLHEAVQSVDPTCRVVYVDNDPIVHAHARDLLTSTPQGRTAYVQGDLRDVGSVLAAPQVTDLLDLARPVAVSLVAVLQFVTDEQQARDIVAGYMAPMPPGSTLTISVVTTDTDQERGRGAVATYNSRGITQKARTRAEAAGLFDGFDLLDPGVVLVSRWRPDPDDPAPDDSQVHMWSGVATKQ
jgi:O-methyltransferase involved in polyketide biosynthesis